MSVDFTYSQTADILYIRLSRKRVAETREFGDSRLVDYAEDGTPVGVEFLGASRGIDPSDLPLPNEIIKGLEKLGVKVFA